MNIADIKNILVVGLGYVGLVTSLCLVSKGYTVIGIDKLSNIIDKVNQGNIPFYEPKLNDLLKEALETNRFTATQDYVEAIKKSNLIFISVGTPSDAQGAIDLTQIQETAQIIGKHLDDKYRIIIIKSTVVPGTTDSLVLPILERESKLKAGINFGLCMNPEFLKEGNAVNDFLQPDRTIIGCYRSSSYDILEQFYKPFGGLILKTNLRTAEMIKYANNAFLATKISFINEIANICRLIGGVDVKDVAEGIGYDYRINPKFLRAGCGFGGSCFPKDLKGLISFAKEFQYSPILLEATLKSNESQAQIMIDMAISVVGTLNHKKIAILGLAFKPNTSDIREASSVRIINRLLDNKTTRIFVYDPIFKEKPKIFLDSNIKICLSLEECLEDADVCLVVTEWDEFKALSPSFFKNLMKTPIIIDGRKIYNFKTFSKDTTLLQIGYKPSD
ncbi:MAG: UDP-glucose dehydrogenase family protein [Promethearchaeota archaeon]